MAQTHVTSHRFEEMLSRARTHTHSHTHHTDSVLRRVACGRSQRQGAAHLDTGAVRACHLPGMEAGGRSRPGRGHRSQCRGAEIGISTAHHAAAALASALACFSAAFVRELAALSPCFLAEAEAAWLGLGLGLGSGSGWGLGSGLG
eukprot:scaffold121949_cov63-Phaeocystis_antarctica.AAC.1